MLKKILIMLLLCSCEYADPEWKLAVNEQARFLGKIHGIENVICDNIKYKSTWYEEPVYRCLGTIDNNTVAPIIIKFECHKTEQNKVGCLFPLEHGKRKDVIK